MTLDEFLTRFECLAQTIDAVDEAARNDYHLASFHDLDRYRYVGIARFREANDGCNCPDPGAFPGTDPENDAEVFTPI